MTGTWLIGVCTSVVMTLGPPPPGLAAPPEPSVQEPIEGPTRPPAQADGDGDGDGDGEPPGIELRPMVEPVEPDPEAEAGSDTSTDGQAAPGVSEPLWPDPGTAPNDGTGAFVAAGVLVPVGVVVPLALLLDTSLSPADTTGIVVAGVGMELIGIGILALAISRQLKLKRWALAYRVQPTAQGGGLLALGGLAGTAGLTLLPLGIWVLARGGNSNVGTGLALAGAGSLGLLTPLALVFGRRRHQAYVTSGGWYRVPLPQVGVAPLLLPRGAGLSLGGRF